MRPHGFALATVVILLALVAVAVFAMTREATLGRDRVDRSNDSAAARYAAEAGLAHAMWVANNSGCASYDLPTTAFGADSYMATFAPTKDSPVTISAKGTTADGGSAGIVRLGAPIYDLTKGPTTLVLQPGAAGKDTFIEGDGGHQSHNQGGSPLLKTDSETGKPYRTLLQFDLSSLSPAAHIQSAMLELDVELSNGSADIVKVHPLTQDWTEDDATWLEYNGDDPWATAGGDYDATIGASFLVDSTGWKIVDVAAIAQRWVDGSKPNYGLILLSSPAAGDKAKHYRSSDHTMTTQHPKLTITYVCECGQVCAGGGSTPQDVLLVVGDPSNLTPEQDDKKLLMEQDWGHTVTLIATSESQAAFNDAAALVDVVYVPELGTTPMNELGTKADGLAVGVITEEARRALKLGGFSLFPFVNSATIEVTDNSHYITETLALGTVTLSTAVQSMWVLKPALAVDLHVLAELGSAEPGLAYLEAGELLNDSTPAPGRRVKLPWGAYDFDVNLFTDDARTIMQRAIEWASATPGPMAHWTLDDGVGFLAVDSEGNHDGTVDGAGWTVGQLGGALDFDGINDYVDVGTFDVVGSGLTMMGWFNAETIPTSDGRVISKADGPNDFNAWWQLSTTDSGSNRYMRMRIKAGGTTTTFADSSVNLSPGQWYFAVATYANSSGDMKLYLDGVEVASGVHAVGGPVDVDPSVPVAIGANGTLERFFDGVLDDVRVYNRTLGASEIADLYGGGSAPVAHWKLDDGSGFTAVDSEGNHDGTVDGAGWTVGQLGGALDFDGINDYVDVGTFDVVGSGLTMMGWFNAETIPDSDPRIISKATSTDPSNPWWQLSARSPGTDRHLRMRVKAGGTTSELGDSTVNLTTGQWYFAVGTYANGSGDMKLYLDGVEVASGLHAVGGPVDVDPSVPVHIGANGTLERFFDGVLDDVRIYDRALNATEISDLFTAGGGGGGGGGPSCAGTIADDFETDDYTGNTGTALWNGNWVEINESNNPSAGDNQVVVQDSGNFLVRVRDNDGGGEGILRSVDLSTYTSATLSFDYWRGGLDNANDYVTVQAWPNGSGEWEEVFHIEGPASDPGTGPPQSGSADISAFIMNDTHLRFITSPTMGNNDSVFFDNIEICGN